MKKESGKTEIYNDYNSELVNLFRCMKYHSKTVKEELNYVLNSREMFQDFMEQYKTRGMTDIQRAARFLFIIKNENNLLFKLFSFYIRILSPVRGSNP